MLATDYGGGKAGRQGATGYDMFRPDPVSGRVEVDKVPGTNIHGANAEAHRAIVHEVEVHEAFECRLQRRHIVKAESFRLSGRVQEGRWETRCEKIRCTTKQDAECAHLIEKTMGKLILDREALKIWHAEGWRADGLPEFAQLLDALFRRVSRDQDRIHRTD